VNNFSSNGLFAVVMQFAADVKVIYQSPQKLSSSEEIHKRLEVCNGCKYRRNFVCMKCGCFIKVKVVFKSMHCTEGFWI
jgi:hypothetical protein